MAYDAGEAFLQIVPSFRGVVEQIGIESARWGQQAGSTFVKTFNEQVRRGIDVSLGPATTAAFGRSGETSGGAFADSFRARVDAALRDLPNPRVGLDATELDAELAHIRERMAALRDVRVGVDLSAEDALAELDRLQARLIELAARSPHIDVKVDAGRAIAQLEAVRAEVDALGADTAIADTEQSVSGLTAALIGLGPALIPISGALIAGFAGAATVVGSLGGAMGVVALGAKGVAAEVKGQVTPAISELQRTAAHGLLPGVEASLTPLLSLLPDLDKFVGSLAHTLGGLASEASTALTDPFWQQFFSYVSATAGPTLQTFGVVVGNLAHGFAGLTEAFAPVVTEVGAGLEHLSGDFASFGAGAAQSSGFQSFLTYLEQTGPQVVHTLLAIGEAIGHLIEAAAPIGTVVLAALHGFAGAISAIPIPVLTALVGAFIGLKIAAFIGPALAAAGTAVAGMASAFGAADGAVVGFGAALDTLELNPIGLAIGAIGAAVGILALSFLHSGVEAKRSADQIVAGYQLQQNSIASYSAALADITRQQDALRIKTQYGAYADPDNYQQNIADLHALSAAYGAVHGPLLAMQANTRTLASEMGISRSAVVSLANAAGVDLTKNVQAAIPKLEAAKAAAEQTHHPVEAAAAAFADLGSKANSTSDDIKDLDTAWNSLIGNFLGKKAAIATAKDSILDLDKALNKSNGSLSTNSKTGREAAIQIQATSQNVQSAIDAIFNASGHWTTQGVKQVRQLVDAMTENLPKGSAAYKRLQQGAENYMSQLAKQAPKDGKNAATGFAHGIGSGQGAAAGAAKGVVGAASHALGQSGGAKTEGLALAQGFAAGMSSDNALVAVASAAGALITYAIHALHSHGKGGSPYKRFIPEGTFLVEGFALGMDAGGPAIDAAARRLVDRASSAIRDATRSVYATIAAAVAPAITDPTALAGILAGDTTHAVNKRLAASNAHDAYQSAKTNAAGYDDMARSLAKVAKAADNAAQKAKSNADAMKDSTAAEKSAKAAAEAHAKSLAVEAKEADAMAKAAQKAADSADKAATKSKAAWDKAKSAAQSAAHEAATAAQTLVQSLTDAATQMMSTINDFESQISTGLTGDYSFSTIWQSLLGTDDNGNPIDPTVGQFMDSLQSVLSTAQDFSADLDTLISQGADSDLILQIVGMGPQAGDEFAKQLIAGGPTMVASFNTVLSSIADAATAGADAIADSFYGPGVNAMVQFIDGLISQFPELRGALNAVITLVAGAFGTPVPSLPAAPTPSGLLMNLTTNGQATVHQLAKGAGETTAQFLADNPRLAGLSGSSLVTGIVQVPHFAAGVTNFGGGVALVGENGPEYVVLPSGASVLPNTSRPPAVMTVPPAATVGGDITVYAQFGEETIEARSVRVSNRVIDQRVDGAAHAARQGVPGGAIGALASPHARAVSRA